MGGGEDGGGVGGPQAHLVPGIQLDNCQIILNAPEIDLKTHKTNSTTKGRKDATAEKAGSVELCFGRDGGCDSGEGAAVMNCKRQTSTKRNAWGT